MFVLITVCAIYGHYHAIATQTFFIQFFIVCSIIVIVWEPAEYEEYTKNEPEAS